MRDALRAELLKARSGFWLLLVLAYSVLLPQFAWTFGGKGAVPPGASPAEATQAMLAYLAACPIAAAFFGSYLVTRDYYYRSIERVVLASGRNHAFVAKLVAGAAGGFVTAIAGMAGWGAITVLLLRERDQPFDLGAGTWQAFGGCLAACLLAAPFGVAIGWIVPNYYLATTVVLVVPIVADLPLLFTAPGIGRFLPMSALAGVARAPIPALLNGALGALVAVGWLAMATWLGHRLFSRREIR